MERHRHYVAVGYYSVFFCMIVLTLPRLL